MISSFQAAGSLIPEMNWLQQQLEDLLLPGVAPGIRGLPRGAFPAMNVGSTPDSVEVIAFLPGIDPKAVAMYAKKIHSTEDLIKRSIAEFHPKTSLQTTHMAELQQAMADAVKLKYLSKPLTKEQLSELIQIPPVKK